MQKQTNGSEQRVQPPEHQPQTGEWKVRGIIMIVGVGVLSGFLLQGHAIFTAIAANLPLLLPLAVTILSIFTRASDIKDFESVLNMSSDIAIGIISFDIWAISVSRSDPSGRVLVNPTTMISGNFVIAFLLSGLSVAIGCVVLTRYPFREARTKRIWLFIALVVAVIVYLAPFGAREPIPKPQPESRQFTVVIPYQDPKIIQILPAFLSNRRLVRVEKNVAATNASDAKTEGINRFMNSKESNQIKSAMGEKLVYQKVVYQEEDVLAFAQ